METVLDEVAHITTRRLQSKREVWTRPHAVCKLSYMQLEQGVKLRLPTNYQNLTYSIKKKGSPFTT